MGTTESGKREHHKLKAYLILQILQRETDEEHTMSAPEIAAALEEIGIEAERRGIYRDIDEIKKVLYLSENECTIQEAEEAIDDPEYGDGEKLIIYDKTRKGFYVRQRRYDYHQIRLLTECVYAAKFLSAKEAGELSSIPNDFVSKYQANTFRHDVLLMDRERTDNTHRRSFSMFFGNTERVKMRFVGFLLDAVVERFGTSGVIYENDDDSHFMVTASVDVSDQFFGWLLGFGRRAKLISLPPIVDKFTAYLDIVREMY